MLVNLISKNGELFLFKYKKISLAMNENEEDSEFSAAKTAIIQ